MSRRPFHRRSVVALGVVLFLGLVWTGCSSTVKERRTDSIKVEDVGVGRYYFFDDVLVPRELSYQADKSFIYETPQFKTGSMVLSKWWLDSRSVVDFFIYHMEKDNWKLVNSFQGKESILNFSKPDKTCTIKIVEKWYGTTEVEVRVGPLGIKKM
jgi:hypothetical protein